MKKICPVFLWLLIALPFASFAGPEKTITRIVPVDSSECYAAKEVTVCGHVYGYYFNPKIISAPTFLDMGAPYPNSKFTVLIGDTDLPKFNYNFEYMVNTDICVTGVVTVYNDKPEMMINDPSQITLYQVLAKTKHHKKNKSADTDLAKN